MLSNTPTNNQHSDSQINYISTTQLAKICGVTRFTIINWVKKGKIRSVTTVGGHRRIPLSEALSLVESLQKKRNAKAHSAITKCWECPIKDKNVELCKNCLMNEKDILQCFHIVKEIGKKKIGSQSDCKNCEYFNRFNKSRRAKDKRQRNNAGKKDVNIGKKRMHILSGFSYEAGRSIKKISKGFRKLKGLVLREDG